MQPSKGLTLVELLVACAILVIAFVAFLSCLVSASKLVRTSRETFYALHSANAKLEEIRGHTFADIVNYYTTSPQNTFEIDGFSPGSSKGSIFIDNDNSDLLKVYIAMCWRSFDGRIIGEDTDLDGDLAVSEDANTNNVMDSPVTLSTLITRR